MIDTYALCLRMLLETDVCLQTFLKAVLCLQTFLEKALGHFHKIVHVLFYLETVSQSLFFFTLEHFYKQCMLFFCLGTFV